MVHTGRRTHAEFSSDLSNGRGFFVDFKVVPDEVQDSSLSRGDGHLFFSRAAGQLNIIEYHRTCLLTR